MPENRQVLYHGLFVMEMAAVGSSSPFDHLLYTSLFT
jgi:hypothetical protein